MSLGVFSIVDFILLVQRVPCVPLKRTVDICARRCSNDVCNLASVDNVPKNWCCSVPNSCTAAVADDNVVLIEVISELHGVAICG